jgi:outer membrane lipopolysaccharide assembly protein LptE/RlpB
MRQLKYFSLLFVAFCTLAGCGFHLRHSQSHIGMKYPVIIFTPSGSNSMYQGVYQALLSSNVNVLESAPKESDAPTLSIVTQNITQFPLVYGPDAELRRERLRMSVVFSFGSKIPDRFELATERDRQLNSKQHLGDNAEKVVIEREMQADIISQLLRYLASHQ